MSWNGSSSAGASAPAPKKPAKKSPNLTHGLIAGGAIVLIGIIALYFVTSEHDEATVEKKGPTQIAEVEPEIAEKTNEVVEVKAKPIDPNARPTKVGEVVNGYVMLPSGRLHRRLGIVTNNMNSAEFDMPWDVFDFPCENEIACFLEMKPGDALFGTRIYNGHFKEQFLESLKHPIVINPDDSDYVKRVKKEVREAKIEMKAAYDRGEDIEKIMLDTRRELQLLGEYKMDLERQVDAVISSGAESAQDVEDCVKAMNSMLEARGIAPVNVGIITRRKIGQLIREKGGLKE